MGTKNYRLLYEWKDGDCPEDPSYKDFWPIQDIVAFCHSEGVACNLADLLQRQENENLDGIEALMNAEGFFSWNAHEYPESYFVGLYQP